MDDNSQMLPAHAPSNNSCKADSTSAMAAEAAMPVLTVPLLLGKVPNEYERTSKRSQLARRCVLLTFPASDVTAGRFVAYGLCCSHGCL